MLALLNWRLWLIAGLIALIPIGYMKGRQDGSKLAEAKHAQAAVLASNEARSLERARQRRADEAGRLAAARSNRLVADNRRARSELDRLRDTISSSHRPVDQSCAAANQRAATAEHLLIQSGELLAEIAGAADKHASDVKLLLDAWPK